MSNTLYTKCMVQILPSMVEQQPLHSEGARKKKVNEVSCHIRWMWSDYPFTHKNANEAPLPRG